MSAYQRHRSHVLTGPSYDMGRSSPLGDDDNTDAGGGSNSPSQLVVPKRRRTGWPTTNQFTTATTVAANVSAATVPVNDTTLNLVHAKQEHEGSGDMVRNDVTSGNSGGSSGTKSSMVGTFSESDVLDCPICFEPLTIPVFQCENGHLTCTSCCINLDKKCPTCSCTIGYNRCTSIEKILNSVQFSCLNLEYGCKETILYGQREEHAKACLVAPCFCPLESCASVGSPEKLYAHFSGTHLGAALQFEFKCRTDVWLNDNNKSVIFQEITDGTIFILNQSDNCDPRGVDLICIGALHSKDKFYYELSVKVEDTTLELKSVAAIVNK